MIVAIFSRYNVISDEFAQLSNNYNTCFDLTLWNSFVKTHLHIPLVEFPCELTSESVFGFGCIALNDKDYDYKIIRVADFCNHHGNKTREVIVYSFNRNCWGLPCVIEDVKDRFRLNEPGVLINNNVHWIFCTPTGFDFIDVHCLRGFDLSLEKWIDLPLPNPSSVRDIYDLHALDGYLCLMVTQVVEYGFDVWAMKEYGVQNSWAPLFSMSDISNCMSLLSPPFASSKDGHGHEFLVRLDGRGYCSPCEFLWLNLRDKSIKEVTGLMPWDVIVCSESLIRVPNGVPDNSQFLYRS